MSETRQRIDRLFDAALDLPAAKRDDWLSRQDEPEAVLLAVARLLAASEEADTRFTPGAALRGDVAADALGESGDEKDRIGERVGPFRIVREIGRGGMAIVYLAERDDGQFEQQVALKVIPSAAPSRDALRRFELERQILASLDHPHIARLLDGGLTDDGLPYFAMELVTGETIDRYCDARKLPLRRRLSLFVDVARAVESAHRKLVVHRDIKPSNILVTNEGEVKLLDFGIAKLLEPGAGDDEKTGTFARAMTPEYASPEQFLGRQMSTASDIYQLGLLLYELLVGRRAYSLAGLDPAEVLIAVCQKPPEQPSTAVARETRRGRRRASDSTIERLERTRSTSIDRLRRSLRGDLDTIVMQALRKEPERRYGSAEALANDVDRYLANRPIAARRDAVLYRGAKFVRRHAVGVAAIVLAAVVVASMAVFYTLRLRDERNAARSEAEKATQIATLLTSLFESADPNETDGAEVSARQLLDRGRQRIADQLAGQPEVGAAMMALIGNIYRRLGLYAEARPLLEEALRLRRETLAPDHADLADSHRLLGVLDYFEGDFEAAREHHEAARRIHEEGGTTDQEHYAEVLRNLSTTYRRLSRFEDARKAGEAALAMEEARLGPDDEALVPHHDGLGLLYDDMGRYDEALRHHQRALEIHLAQDDPSRLRTATLNNNLANLLGSMGRNEEAAARYQAALDEARAVLPPEHPQIAGLLVNLGHVYTTLERYEEAIATLHQSGALIAAAEGRDHLRFGLVLANLATAESALAHYDQALRDIDEAIANFRRNLGPSHGMTLRAEGVKGQILTGTGHYAAAEELLTAAIAASRQALGAGHPETAALLHLIGEVYLATGDTAKARAAFAEALEIRAESLPADHPQRLQSEAALAGLESPGAPTPEAPHLPVE